MGIIYIVVIIGGIAGIAFLLFFNRQKDGGAENKIDIKLLQDKFKSDCKELSERFRIGLSNIPRAERKAYLNKFKEEREVLNTKYKFNLKNPKDGGGVGSKDNEVKTKTLPEDVRVYDNILGTIYNTTISGAGVDKILSTGDGTLGRKWLRNGKWVYALNRKYNQAKEICFEPVIVPATLDNPPSRLRRALSHPYVAITWNVKRPVNFVHKYGVFLLFAAFVAFLMFMLIAR